MARTERKVAAGYHGFVFHTSETISLEEDLKRRDLTINAMALDGNHLIDPYGGLNDIRNKLLRHVSEAFKEDPVRILRIARFSAKLPDFRIAPETLELLKEMVANGEADSLVPERVFLEMRKTLSEKTPSRFVTVLQNCGLWQRFFNNFRIDQTVFSLLDKNNQLEENEKFALLTHSEDDINKVKKFMSILKPPTDISETVFLWNKLKKRFNHKDAENILKVIEEADAIRRPQRLKSVLNLAHVVYTTDKEPWLTALEHIKKMDSAKIAASCSDKSMIGHALHSARLRIIEELV